MEGMDEVDVGLTAEWLQSAGFVHPGRGTLYWAPLASGIDLGVAVYGAWALRPRGCDHNQIHATSHMTRLAVLDVVRVLGGFAEFS